MNFKVILFAGLLLFVFGIHCKPSAQIGTASQIPPLGAIGGGGPPEFASDVPPLSYLG